MAQVPFLNNTKKPQWIGTVCIMPGKTRAIDEAFLPSAQAAKFPENLEDGVYNELLNQVGAEVIAQLSDFDLSGLQTILTMEEGADKPRKGVIAAINKTMLALAQDTNIDPLADYANTWREQDLSALQTELEIQKDDADKSAILHSLIEEKS